MSDQDMINAIVSSIQNDANMLILIRSLLTVAVDNMTSDQLRAACTTLGISYA